MRHLPAQPLLLSFARSATSCSSAALVAVRLAILVLPFLAASSNAQLAQSLSARSGGQTAPIHIRVNRPDKPLTIPATLFGSFLEPIGHSTYGGLWSELLVNSSFEEGLWSDSNLAAMVGEHTELREASSLGLPTPWQPLNPRQGNRYEPVRGDAANSNQSLLIMSLPGKEVGVMQEIYLPVRRELTYKGSIFVKHVSGPGTVDISLRRHAHREETLVSTTIAATSPEWTKYSFQLQLHADELAPLEPADFVISLADDARALVDNVSLMPADAIDGMDPDVIAMARELQSPVVRFGGNFTSAYDWKDGIGPMDKRVSKINLSWGIPEYNTFGTDEFLRFCELVGAQPQIALNLGTGTPEEAAEWVSYVNHHWGDKRGGLLWEMGNELWGDWQVGYPSIERIAAVTLATSRAVRRVDPAARLIATGGDEETFQAWNAQQLTNPVGSFNYLSTHFVVGDNVLLRPASNEFRIMAALALPWGLSGPMHAIKQQAVAAGHKDVNIAFTEWLMISDSHTGLNYSNMGGALFAGGFLNMLMRNSDVISISDMTGILEFGGIWKQRQQVYGTPAYWVLRTYAGERPHTLLAVNSDTPTYSISKGVDRLPEIASVPYLDVVAAKSEDGTKLVLLCVNRDLTRSERSEIDLRGLGIAAGTVKVTTIAADSILAENNEEHPQSVAPTTRMTPYEGTLDFTFPNASVTVLEVPITAHQP